MRRVAPLLVTSLILGCGLFAPPRWVSVHPPRDPEWVYGVGASGPTDDRDASAERIAVARSFEDLSWQVRLLVAEQLGPGSPRDPLVVPPLLEGELDGAEIVEVWVDAYDDVPGDGRTFALTRVAAERIDAIVARLGGGASDG